MRVGLDARDRRNQGQCGTAYARVEISLRNVAEHRRCDRAREVSNASAFGQTSRQLLDELGIVLFKIVDKGSESANAG